AVRGLNRKPAGPFSTPLRNIRLSVKGGEILGIAGVAGNGQGELFEALSGEVPQAGADTVQIRGQNAGRLSITGRRLLGAAFVPEERLGRGAAPNMTLSENLLLSRHATDRKTFLGAGGVVRNSVIAAAAQRIIKAM